MKFLTSRAKITCKHVTGIVQILLTRQHFVTVEGAPVLVEGDPAFKPIVGCANVGPTIKPCMLTLGVTAGYSTWIKIAGHAVCLDTVTGITDGTVPGTVKYTVRNPGQDFVAEVPE